MPTLRRRKNGTYSLRWRENGQAREQTLSTKNASEARALLRARELELQRAAFANITGLPSAHVPSLAEFCEEYLDWHAREYPASSWRIAQLVEQHLLPALGHKALDRITRGDLERYKASRTARPATIAKELRALQAILNRAEFLEIATNRARGVKAPASVESKPIHWYAPDQLERLYAASAARAGDEAKAGREINAALADFAPVWRLLANTGLRRAEALALEWGSVTKADLRVVSSADARTKSGKWRPVPLSPGARASLEQLRAITGGGRHVLPRMAPESLSRAFDRCRSRAGLEGSLHSLRHTFCASLVSAGVALRTVQVLAGHAHYSTTERYAHLAPGALVDAVARLSI